MASRLIKKTVSGITAIAFAGGIALTAAAPSSAADGMTNNWSNWWAAHAEIEIWNHSNGFQSVARLGNDWRYGARSFYYSVAHVDGYNWTHNAYQIRFA